MGHPGCVWIEPRPTRPGGDRAGLIDVLKQGEARWRPMSQTRDMGYPARKEECSDEAPAVRALLLAKLRCSKLQNVVIGQSWFIDGFTFFAVPAHL